MHAMLPVIGKFINNFKDFYNEINSATLTGAIDVIVVQQPDGTHICSPFHVRFGKIGVLRSREKVVDIEVNGCPVNIHMKLGDSGEAFFVEEVCDENEIPPYLATSPIPDVPNIESELQKMKLFTTNDDSTPQEPQHSRVITTTAASSSATVDLHFSSTADLVLNNTSSHFDDNKGNCDNEQQLASAAVPSKTVTVVHTDSSDEVKTKRKRRKKVAMKKRSRTKEQPPRATPPIAVPPRQSKDSETHEEIFQMDDDYTEVDDEGFASTGGALSRSVSLPVSANLDDLFGSSEWNHRKTSSTFTGEFHPFSDGDVSPHSSPIASRPPSPKSDTEYENQKLESAVIPSEPSGPSWGWGQLPNVPRRLSDTQLQSSRDELRIAIQHKEEGNDSADVDKRSMLGGVLNFMRSTKKIRHMPETEGIYLSELNVDELDPELAALYFPKFNNHLKDPSSSGGASSQSKAVSSYPYSDIAMSLCGGLQDPETDLPEERFLHSLVTFDEFTENPGILHDPNLVIRIGGKYYNWPTAASMLTSIIMFQRPLPEKTANQLIHEHMPKKKKSKSYSSWWSWRRSEEETKTEADILIPPAISELTPTSDVTEVKVEEESGRLPMETCRLDTVPVTIVEQSIVETVSTVTEVVSGMHDLLIEESEVTTALTEVVVESSTPPETELNVIPASSESSTTCSSPIEIATPTGLNEISVDDKALENGLSNIRPSGAEYLSLLMPETVVAQMPPGAKDDGEKSLNREKYKKSLRLTSQQIAKLNLREGPNEFVFSVTTAYQGTTKCTCQVFLWKYDDKIVISDIDGTITKSDVLGHILPMVGHSWAQLGVAKLFTKIQSNGYKFLYLSARAIGQARITREYLRRLRQGEICLPDGPLLLSPTSLISALHREVIERKPEEFKISCLKDIQTLFPSIMGNPFYAGFGNKINDTWAYRAVGIPTTRVFTINHKGELKLELIQTFQSSYTRLSDDVDHVFPPLKPTARGMNGHPLPVFSSPEEFSYFTYWRDPVPSLSEDDTTLLKQL